MCDTLCVLQQASPRLLSRTIGLLKKQFAPPSCRLRELDRGIVECREQERGTTWDQDAEMRYLGLIVLLVVGIHRFDTDALAASSICRPFVPYRLYSPGRSFSRGMLLGSLNDALSLPRRDLEL